MDDTNEKPDQAFEDTFKQTYAPNITARQKGQITNIPEHYEETQGTQQDTPQPGATQVKHRKAILLSGFAISTALIVVGVVLQVAQPTVTELGNVAENVGRDIDLLDSEIDQLYEEESEIFEKSGFSDAYYDAAEKTAEKVEQKYLLESDLDTVYDKNVVETGAIWFFVASGVVALLSLIIFFVKTTKRDN